MATANTPDMVDGHQMTPRTRSNAALHRDAALARIGSARRWLIAGAAGLTAGLAAFVSATAHGRTLRHGQTRVAVRTVGSSSTAVQMPPLASPTSLGLQGPVVDPQSSSSGSSQSQSNPAPSQSAQSQAPAASVPSPSSSAVVSGGS